MKNQTLILLIACVATGVLSGCATAHPPAAYEHKIIRGHITTSRPSLEKQLEQAAADGWQVVSSGSDNGIPFIVLKRAK